MVHQWKTENIVKTGTMRTSHVAAMEVLLKITRLHIVGNTYYEQREI